MSHEPRALDNPINWSFGVGRLFGIRIRVHLLFLLGAVYLIVRAMRDDGPGFLYGLGSLAILWFIVLLHEFGHCFAARAVGGRANEILMWPLGGLAYVDVPHTSRANFVTTAAGPAVNLVICLLTAGALIAMAGSGWAVPWNPFRFAVTHAPIVSELQWWLVVTFALSYMLLLFNLAPVFPFDGGRLFQCLVWPSKGFKEATNLATKIGMVGAIGFGVLGIVFGETLLLCIAVFGYLTCWQQRRILKHDVFAQESEFGYDFSQGYTSLEHGQRPQRRPGFFARRRAARAARRAERERQQLEEHRRRVDAILAKISQHGADALTPEERRILEFETQRRRSREP